MPIEIPTWEIAEGYAEEYAKLNSMLELLHEAFKAFAETRQTQVGRGRVVGPLTIGFRKVAPSVALTDEASFILVLKRELDGRFVETIEQVDRVALKKLLANSKDPTAKMLLDAGAIYRGASAPFYLKLNRLVAAEIDR
jgi:phage host-nuclease inhibitor protein Gam